MRWMHISDIHMNVEYNDAMSNAMRRNILKFIEENKITTDYLFVTGDYRDLKYMAADLREDIEYIFKQKIVMMEKQHSMNTSSRKS